MSTRRAFTLIELLVVIAIIALLVGIILPAVAQARESARKVLCLSNQRQYAVASGTYMNDFDDFIPAYSWRRGSGPEQSQFTDLRFPSDDGKATMNQATDIVRRRTYLTNAAIPTRLPHREYTHLILIDYLTLNLPEPIVACPSDRQRKDWQQDPENDRTNVPSQGQWGDVYDWMWFSSTYQVVPASWAPDMKVGTGNAGAVPEQLAADHNWFSGGNVSNLGRRKYHSVRFPAQKAFMFEFYDYHSTRVGMFYAYEQAMPELLLFDGSAKFVRTADINPGFKPNRPQVPGPTTMIYNPQPFEPPAIGDPQERLIGRVRWTRGGLGGIDIGGAEVYTGQPSN